MAHIFARADVNDLLEHLPPRLAGLLALLKYAECERVAGVLAWSAATRRGEATMFAFADGRVGITLEDFGERLLVRVRLSPAGRLLLFEVVLAHRVALSVGPEARRVVTPQPAHAWRGLLEKMPFELAQ